MSWFEKVKLIIRFIRKWGRPPRYFRSNYSPDELSSLVESASFKVEEAGIIGDRVKVLYLRGRKR